MFVVDMVDLSADEADALMNMLLIGPAAALFATATPKNLTGILVLRYIKMLLSPLLYGV